MRPNRKAISLGLVLFAVLWACAPTFVQNSYRALSISKESYEAIVSGAADLYGQGKITTAAKDQIIKLGEVWYAAHFAAVSALSTYKRTELASDQEKASVALTEASKAIMELLDYIRPIFTKNGLEVPSGPSN